MDLMYSYRGEQTYDTGGFGLSSHSALTYDRAVVVFLVAVLVLLVGLVVREQRRSCRTVEPVVVELVMGELDSQKDDRVSSLDITNREGRGEWVFLPDRAKLEKRRQRKRDGAPYGDK